jgi:hypothetical protein
MLLRACQSLIGQPALALTRLVPPHGNQTASLGPTVSSLLGLHRYPSMKVGYRKGRVGRRVNEPPKSVRRHATSHRLPDVVVAHLTCDENGIQLYPISIVPEGIIGVTIQQQNGTRRGSEASVRYQRPSPDGQAPGGEAMRGLPPRSRRKSSQHPKRSSQSEDSPRLAPPCGAPGSPGS